MFEIYFFIAAIVGINIYFTFLITKDDIYFLDEEKPRYIMMVWLIPLVGAFIGFYRLHADKNFYMSVMAIYFLLRFGFHYLLYKAF